MRYPCNIFATTIQRTTRYKLTRVISARILIKFRTSKQLKVQQKLVLAKVYNRNLKASLSSICYTLFQGDVHHIKMTRCSSRFKILRVQSEWQKKKSYKILSTDIPTMKISRPHSSHQSTTDHPASGHKEVLPSEQCRCTLHLY